MNYGHLFTVLLLQNPQHLLNIAFLLWKCLCRKRTCKILGDPLVRLALIAPKQFLMGGSQHPTLYTHHSCDII